MASRDINDLIPELRPLCQRLINEITPLVYPSVPFITNTYRSFKEQNDLYAIGRTVKGNKVTNARGGESFHNCRRAFDICFKSPRRINDPKELKYYKEDELLRVGSKIYAKNEVSVDWSSEIFDFVGKRVRLDKLEWGGDWWVWKDRPHFQYTFCSKHNKSHSDPRSFKEDGTCNL